MAWVFKIVCCSKREGGSASGLLVPRKRASGRAFAAAGGFPSLLSVGAFPEA